MAPRVAQDVHRAICGVIGVDTPAVDPSHHCGLRPGRVEGDDIGHRRILGVVDSGRPVHFEAPKINRYGLVR